LGKVTVKTPQRRRVRKWVPLIRTAWLDAILGTDRNIQLLLHVPVVVTEQETETPIGIGEPSFVGGRDALPRVMRRLDIDRLLREQESRARRQQDDS
jgi:hypothetical protein